MIEFTQTIAQLSLNFIVIFISIVALLSLLGIVGCFIWFLIEVIKMYVNNG